MSVAGGGRAVLVAGASRKARFLFVVAMLLAAVAAGFTVNLIRAPPARADTTSFVPDTPFGFHSMLYLNSPTPLKQLMFSEAQAAGVSWIRVDISLGALENPYISQQMWADVSQYEQLSEQYGIHVLADLPDTDGSLTTCSDPSDDPTRCGISVPANLTTYGQEVGALAGATAGVIDDFEIINEPDAPSSFSGTPQEYAWMLRTAYDAIHQANPSSQVAIGGIMNPVDQTWLAEVFATPGTDAAQAFDVANFHLRDPLDELASEVASWKGFFAQYGDGSTPLWVTETGYASDPTYQEDPAFHGVDADTGLSYQAAYIEELVPTLLNAGVSKIFVTERDNLVGESASEGLLGGWVSDDDANTNPDAVDISDTEVKPSFAIYQQLAQAALAAAENPPAPTTIAPAPAPPPVVHKAVHKKAKRQKVKTVCKTKKVHGRHRRVCTRRRDDGRV
jgi:archaellum component FlaG (FlaF/FlaG flagellin family)